MNSHISILTLIILCNAIEILAFNSTNVQHSNFSLYEEFPDEDRVAFWMFTKERPYAQQELKFDTLGKDLSIAKYNPKHSLRVLVHGWKAGPAGRFVVHARKAYRKKDVNVFVADWGMIADDAVYVFAKAHIKNVGYLVARMIWYILMRSSITPRDVTVVGDGLGAHLAGHVGKEFVKTLKRGSKLGAIIGLDPVGALFTLSDKDARLDKDDAEYVEVIHTNGGSLITGQFGFLDPIGTADFYPNYGMKQPGCDSNNCNHERSVDYFVESLRSVDGFWARNVQSYESLMKGELIFTNKQRVTMGGDPPNIGKAEGIYFLQTNNKWPFAPGGRCDNC